MFAHGGFPPSIQFRFIVPREQGTRLGTVRLDGFVAVCGRKGFVRLAGPEGHRDSWIMKLAL